MSTELPHCPPQAYGYYSSGSDDQWSLRENKDALKRYRLLPRVLVNVGSIDMGTQLFGELRSGAEPQFAAPLRGGRGLSGHAGRAEGRGLMQGCARVQLRAGIPGPFPFDSQQAPPPAGPHPAAFPAQARSWPSR